MIDDKEVKTAVSPFAVRENERKIFDGKEGFASINQVVFKMDMGYINEDHIKALQVVNEFTFVTSRQVTQILEHRKKLEDIEPDKRQDKISKWLEDMTKSKILSRYYFQNEQGKSSYRVYAMDKLATYILKERNIATEWQPTENSKPAYALKRKLAGNQILIAYMQKVEAFQDVNTNLLLFSKKYNVKFKPTGGVVRLKNDKQELNFIFEIVRRNEDWQNMFGEKVQLYSDFYENFAKNDAGFSEPPQIVFVGEDFKHLTEMFRIVKKVSTFLEDKDLYFTEDLKQLENSLQGSIITFEKDENNNKYKTVVQDLEILKPGENDSSKLNLNTSIKYNSNMIVE